MFGKKRLLKLFKKAEDEFNAQAKAISIQRDVDYKYYMDELEKTRLAYNKNCNAEFDIEGEDTYAIRRIHSNGIPYTSINYLRDGKECEYACRTTDEMHDHFVERLTAKIDDGSNPKVARTPT